MFQSRWGFHPCDYSTYRKLKFLHFAYLKAVRLAHAWQRWHRKDPHNRVMRRRIRNDGGQTIGYEPPAPLPEPSLSPVFSQKVLEKRHVDKKGQHFRDGFLEEKVVTDDFGIVADYAAARKPAQDSAGVRPVRMSVETINALYERARQWLEQGDVR
jgi:hypothetical protein